MSEPVVDQDVAEDTPSDDPLLRSVTRLSARVEALGTAMFSRADAKQARRRMIWGVLAVILIAQVISIGTFVGVASTCFIRTSPPKDGSVLRTVCNAIPGYDKAITKGVRQQGQFQQLLNQIPANQQEIARLKARVARLEQQHP